MFIQDPQRSDQGLIVLPNGTGILYTEYDYDIDAVNDNNKIIMPKVDDEDGELF